ncbi:MAG: hypothetical protein GF330_02350 [Candidatus Eisenbacteria bacterium]|nr:hypothetical protein [Candidatus Eisenbacteria bacterium]
MATKTISRGKKSKRASSASKGSARRGGGGNGDGRRGAATATLASPPEMLREQIRERLARALESDNVELLISGLVQVARRRPPSEAEAVKAFLFQELLREMTRGAPARRKLWSWTRLCAARPETEAREIACAVLDRFWKERRKDVERLTLNLARDEHWEVRQYAAGTMARIVCRNFRLNQRYLQRWSRHADPSVRRQVVMATVAIADAEHPERAKPLLALLEAHLADRDPFIRRNLGPYALGQGMLAAYPEETFEQFREWSASDDEIVRWNLAMAFTSPVAPLHAERSMEILRCLACDPRRFVWSAAALALRNLVHHQPQRIGPVLKDWMEEPPLRVAVASALNRSVR